MKTSISFFVAVGLLVLSASCKDDFLTQKPVGAYDQTTINTPAGVRAALVGAYSVVNGTNGLVNDPMQPLFGSIRGGEAHKGSTLGDQQQMLEVARFELTSGNSSVNGFLTYYYNGVYRTNLVLQALAATTGISATDAKQIEAEARFLRGHYHFMLKRLFKNIMFIDEKVTDTRIPNTDAAGNYIEVWPQIIADFEFGMNNLSATNTAQLGSPNKWAAQAYMAKALLYAAQDGVEPAANYSKALTLFKDVVANGVNNKGTKYALYANYHENFDVTKENGSEWVWGAQNSILDGSSATGANGNPLIGFAGVAGTTGPCGCGGNGFFNPSQWFVNHFRTDANGLPILDDATRNANGIKSYTGAFNAATFVPDAGPIDPRLDWSVGRVTVPFLDYGDFNTGWVRAPNEASVYLAQKYFTRKSELGTLSAGIQNALNVAVIRYADVLLMTAELEARVGTLSNAMALVNQVRNRMATNTTSPENWVKTTKTSAAFYPNAANYKIATYPASALASGPFDTKDHALEAILMERTLELGLEGHRGYDLIRFGRADGMTDVKKFNGYIAFESQLRGYLAGALYTPPTDALAPFPTLAIDYSFKDGTITWKQNPGY